MMRDNELLLTVKWPQGTNVKHLIPPAIVNKLAAQFAEQIVKETGKPLEDFTYELAGTTHNVPIKTAA